MMVLQFAFSVTMVVKRLSGFWSVGIVDLD